MTQQRDRSARILRLRFLPLFLSCALLSCATLSLTPGMHDFRVTFLQGGEFSLLAGWSSPGLARQEIPPDVLFYVAEQARIR
jgi:hypothetical protein